MRLESPANFALHCARAPTLILLLFFLRQSSTDNQYFWRQKVPVRASMKLKWDKVGGEKAHAAELEKSTVSPCRKQTCLYWQLTPIQLQFDCIFMWLCVCVHVRMCTEARCQVNGLPFTCIFHIYANSLHVVWEKQSARRINDTFSFRKETPFSGKLHSWPRVHLY